MLVAEWLGQAGPIAQHLRGYEPRPQQRAMADAVARAFAEGHHLAVEAGTGVGKTFAYLLPALEQVVAHHRRVVVSTHTIALQEQLIEKDVPFLRRALGLEFRAELVKGRQNYLSLRRLKGASERQKSLMPNIFLRRALHAVEDWAYQTTDGSLSDLAESPPPEVWEKVRSEHNNCLGRRCPTYTECFYQRARRRAEQADLLIVNHALLIADLVLRQQNVSVLPDYDLAILDEAHTLEQVATSQLGANVSNAHLQHLLAGLFNERTGKGFLAQAGDDPLRQLVVSTQRACTDFFQQLADWQRTRGRANGRLIAPLNLANPLSPALDSLASRLEALKQQLPREEDRFELGSYVERAREQGRLVDELLTQTHAEHVYWTDVQPTRTTLAMAPLNVGPALRTLLFDPLASAVLTSATLAAEQDDRFAYLLGRLGIPETKTLRLGSPFDYARQVTLHIEAGLPDPAAGEAFVAAASRAIVHYLQQSEGRAFVLFTSYSMLADAARRVRAELEADGYTILAQGEALPRSKMLAQFRATPRAAIFGTDSFWQGVDVVGEALSNVTIVKLPFAVPDRPMIEARIDQIRRQGGNAFQDYQLPEAVLKFRQGFGRLIRSRTDHGIVVVLDPRVVRKSYGRRFLDSLPAAPRQVSERPW